MRDVFLAALTERATVDRRIMLITADLGFKVLDQFRELCPAQFLNIGIAEQNMIGVATGLALSGKVVFVYSIANFSSLRCLEQIRNDACYHGANVKIVSIGSGFSYGQLGISHHATEDISIMRALPDLAVYSPGTDHEVRLCADLMIDTPGTAYIRIDREGTSDELLSHEKIDSCAAHLIRKGSKIALISTGGILKVSLMVADTLSQRGISPSVVSLYGITPPPVALLTELARTHDYLFTLEEHSIHGGLGGLVAEVLMELDVKHPVFRRFGLRDGFTSVVGDQNYLRSRYGIDARTIMENIESVLTQHGQNL